MKKQLVSISMLLMLLISILSITAPITPASASPTTYYVNDATGDDTRTPLEAQNPLTPWKTITHAISQVAASDTIIVAAGTYDEQVVITQSLTLQGAGDTTIIQPSGTDKLTSFYTLGTQAGAFWNGHKLASIISVENVGTAGVTVENLKVDGVNVNGLPAGANYVVGISYSETAGTIDDVTVINMNSVPVATRTYGMWLDAVSTSVSVEVKDSRISYYNKNGIIARGAVLTANIHDNTIIGPGDGGVQVPNGIVFAFEAGDTARYNDISALHYTLGTWLGFGIMGYQAKDGLIIEYNVVHDSDVGIGPSSYGLIRYNEIYDCYQGIELEWAAECAYNNITCNQIHDNTYGIHLLGPGSPYYTGPGDEPGPGNTANYNNIYDNTEGVRNWDTTQTFDARFNWWGHASGPTHSSNPSGTGDIISNNVDYSPWLGFVVGTSPMTWHVNPSGAPGAISEAVYEASSGDTIIVHDGTYNEQVVIDKSLTVQGTGSTPVIKPIVASLKWKIFSGRYWGGIKQIAGIIVANVADGSSVTLKNLIVDGENVTGKPAGADYVTGIFYRETGGLIDTVTIANMTIDATGTAVRAYGIYLSAIVNTVSVEIKYCNITNYDKNGINAHGDKLTVNIHDNTVTGRGPLPEGDEVQNGIVIMDSAIATVNSNTISDMAYIPETWWSAGIMFYSSGCSATSNTITDTQIGIIFQDASGSAQDNTVNGGTVGLLSLWAQYTQGGTWTASFVNNTVSGAKDSPGYDNGAIGAQTWNALASLTVTIEDNQIIGGGATSADGIYIGDIPEYDPAGSIIAFINDNNISGWHYGVNLVSSVNSGSTISGNNITDTYLGIRMQNASGVQICDNRITDFTKGGIVTRAAKNILIEGNIISTTLHDEAPNGIDIGTYNGTTGTVKGNTISGCSWNGFTGDYETSWSGSGILVIESGDSLEILGNTVHDCDVGMDIESDSMNMTCNEVYNNQYGFVFWNANPKINYNNIYNNMQYGVYRTASGDLTGVLDARCNWWGDPTGPYHGTSWLYMGNPYGPHYGLGDNVTDYVLYDPWLDYPKPLPSPLLKVEPPTYHAKQLGETFDINITINGLSWAWKLVGVEFKLRYNTTLLEIVEVSNGTFMEQAGETLYYGPIIEEDYVQLGILLIPQGTGIGNWTTFPSGNGTLATITFRVKYQLMGLENPILSCNLTLFDTILGDTESNTISHDVEHGYYDIVPTSMGDLNFDGRTNILDCIILAGAFGTRPSHPRWNPLADINHDKVVNILDCILIANHFGEVRPDP